mgnify:FL=1
MKQSTSWLYIVLFILVFFLHFAIWQLYVNDFQVIFIRYYLFLTILFMMVITIMSIVKKIYPEYIGFTFMGLMLFKLSVMFLVMNKIHLSEVPYHKYHFIPPYLVSLLLETLFAIGLLKEQKNN